MTRLDNAHEGTTGTAVPSTAAGGPNAYDTTVVSGAGTTLTFDSAHVQTGDTSILVSMAANVGSTAYLRWAPGSVASAAQGFLRLFVYLTANPTVTTRLATFLNNGNARASISITNTGRLSISGGGSGTATGTVALPLNQWIPVEFELTNLSGTTGDVACRAYNSAYSSVLSGTSLSVTGATTNGSTLNEVRLGVNNSTTQTSAWSMWLDTVAYSDVSQPGAPVTGAASGTASLALVASPPRASASLTLAATAAVQGTWYSGVYTGGSFGNADAFGTWRNKAPAYVNVFPNKGTWSNYDTIVEAASAASGGYTGPNVMFSIAPWARTAVGTPGVAGAGPGDWANAAAGTYDTHWTNLANALVSAGQQNCLIRWAWEWNGNFSEISTNADAATVYSTVSGIQYSHNLAGGDQRDNMIAATKRFKAILVAAGWTGKLFLSPAHGKQYAALPDPSYVADGLIGYIDGIIPDAYDRQNSTTTDTYAERWANITGDSGRAMDFWRDYCAAHKRPNGVTPLAFGFGEWGLWNDTTIPIVNDDVQYITDMRAYIRNCVDNLGLDVYEAYFDVGATDGDHYIGPSTTVFPNAAQAYLSNFGTTSVGSSTATLTLTGSGSGGAALTPSATLTLSASAGQGNATVVVGDITITDATAIVRVGDISITDSSGGSGALVRVGEITVWEIADSEYFDGTQWVTGTPPPDVPPPVAATITAAAEPSNAPPRVLIQVQYLTGTTATVVRNNADGTMTTVRGGDSIALASGGWIGYDYEPAYGTVVSYTVTTDIGETGTSNAVNLDPGQSWLIHAGIPALSRPLRVMSLGERTRPTNQGVHNVLSRRDPIVRTDGQRRSPAFNLQVGTESLEDEAALLALLDDASPLLLQLRSSKVRRTFYGWVSIGDVNDDNLSPYLGSEIVAWTLPCTQVAAPVGGVQTQRSWDAAEAQWPGKTWDDMRPIYATWHDAFLDQQAT